MTRPLAIAALLVTFAAGLGSGALIGGSDRRTEPDSLSLPPLPPAEASDSVSRERETLLVRATRTASPSVVAVVVETRQVVRTTTGDPFFDMFLGARPQVRQARSFGSGVIVDRRGYVVTNHHVVENASEGGRGSIRITLPDGREFPARLVGTDPDNDLAVLKVDADSLPSARLATGAPRIGEWALAIGNPYGYLIDDVRPSVTVGVISAVDRSFTPGSGIALRHVLQTDAAINPGNSGGALVNALGELVGINTFIFTGGGQSQGSIGLGFAIPADRALRIVEEIVRYGRVRRFSTGLTTDPVAARAMGLGPGDGVLVSEVRPGSSGAKAGIRSGDVIVGADGRRISDLEELRSVLRLFRVGETVSLRVRRGRAEQEIRLVLEEDAE